MEFNYYYGQEAEQFSFIRIPKQLLLGEEFSSLSLQAKLLYGVLLDRMTLSMKNKWLDEQNRVYIIYQISEIEEDLGFSRKKAIAHLKELEKIGLVEKKRRGFGLPNLLYVKNFIFAEAEGLKSSDEENNADQNTSSCNKKADERNYTNRSVDFDTSRGSLSDTSRSADTDTYGSGDFDTSRSADEKLQEVREAPPYIKTNIIKTNQSKTKRNHTDTNHIISINDGDADLMPYSQVIKSNISYDVLMSDHPLDWEVIEEIFELLLETVSRKDAEITIAGYTYPAEVVRSRMLKVTAEHVEYVLECLKKTTTKIVNIKSYLLAALFNSPATMSSYYDSQVRSDLRKLG